MGLFINGWVSERFRYRYTVMTCLSLIIAFTAIFFTAQSVMALQVAEILCGLSFLCSRHSTVPMPPKLPRRPSSIPHDLRRLL